MKRERYFRSKVVNYCPGDLKYNYIFNGHTLFLGLTVPSVVITSIFYYKIFQQLRTTRLRGSRNSSLNVCFFVICMWWFLSNLPQTAIQVFVHLFPDYMDEVDNHWVKSRFWKIGYECALLVSNSYSFVNSIVLIACVRQFSDPLKALLLKLFTSLSTRGSRSMMFIEQLI